MADWQELVQSVIIGLIFSFLVAKLISILISFRADHLKLVRQQQEEEEEEEDYLPFETVDESDSNPNLIAELEPISEKSGTESTDDEDENGGSNEQQRILFESLFSEEEDDDDDWEDIESSSELDEAFSAASAFVAASASDRLSPKVSNDVQLQLYGFYKIATEGPCNIPQPSAVKMSARAKWNAWQKLGDMTPEEAMQQYIMIVSELYPTWATGSTAKKKGGDSDPSSSAATGRPMGPVFSTYIYEESGSELKMEAIHDSAREGEVESMLQYIESGISVNLKDSEGRTPLHWAVDRGHLSMVELLISKSCDVNAKDNDGQTPLHYAAICEREAIAEILVKQNADTNVKDNEGNSPCDICEVNWPWMHQSSSMDN